MKTLEFDLKIKQYKFNMNVIRQNKQPPVKGVTKYPM